MEKINGTVEKIVYCDNEKEFGVIKVKVSGYRELITMIGSLSTVNIGSIIEVSGDWNVNNKFGRQFKVTEWQESVPSDIYGIEKYLGSGLIKGIGPKLAKTIVETFGLETFEIIEKNPNKLFDIPKLGKSKVESIISNWNNKKDINRLMMFLQKIGISASLGKKIFEKYGSNSIDVIKNNPYQLINDIYGIGFKTADIIAQSLGLDRESYNRCKTGIIYILEYMANYEGHCYLPIEELIERSSKMLKIEEDKITMTYDSLINEGILIKEDNKIYLPCFFRAEIGLSKKIRKIKETSKPERISYEDLDEEIIKVEARNEIEYDDIQKLAIRSAVLSNFIVITGGAGLGKTTITKAIIDIFTNQGRRVILTAPTGKAAKRLSEVTHLEAKTIHRLLEAQKYGGFSKNENNKIVGDVIIIDEASMVDLILMNNLLKAVPDESTVILIGDSNQLASVGPGNVLKDIINSDYIEVIRLNKIYRQAKTSNIILNSHKINNGEMIELHNKADSNFFFIKEDDDERSANLIASLCSNRLPNCYKIDSISDIQVLTPMRKGLLGVDNLNKILQSTLNNNKIFLQRDVAKYYLGDKVMQIKNNYEKEVFNGDIGIISSIDKENEEVEINFDSRIIKYSISDLEEIKLAYACTIHKAQGGEYPIVIIPMTNSHFIMLERNLLYTGVTRAKRVCILIGKEDAIKTAIENDSSRVRYTSLSQRLNKYCDLGITSPIFSI